MNAMAQTAISVSVRDLSLSFGAVKVLKLSLIHI